MWGDVLDSSDLLLSYPSMSLVLPMTCQYTNIYSPINIHIYPYAKLLGETIHNDEDKATIMGASNRAVRCVQLIGDTVESLPPDLMSAQDKGRVGDEVSTLLGIIGGAEQMVRTPVPKSYSRHTSRSLSLLTWTYPLVLLPDLGWKTVPVIAFVSWLLFAIEEIGHMIENPFDQGKSKV